MENSRVLYCRIGTVSQLYEYFDKQVIGCGLRQLKHVQRPFLIDQILKNYKNDLNNKQLLEVGAGFDDSSNILAEKYDAKVSVIDKYENEWNSRKNMTYDDLVREHPKVKYIYGLAGSPEDHKIPDSSFDCIFSSSVLEHVPKRKFGDVLVDIDRMLKPNGIQVHAIDFPVDRGKKPLQFYIDHFKNWVFMEDHGKLDAIDLDKVRADPDTFYETPEIFKLYWGHGNIDRRDVKFGRWASLNIVLKKMPLVSTDGVGKIKSYLASLIKR